MFRVSCCCGISLGWEHLVLSSSGILFFLLLTLSILREGGGGGEGGEYKPYDLKCLPSKSSTQKPHKSMYIYKEHQIFVYIRLKNYGIYETT